MIIAYSALGVAIGAYAWNSGSYSIVISSCLGGMFILASGLLHVALSPKRAKLSKAEQEKIGRKFEELKTIQAKQADDLEKFKNEIYDEVRAREEKITNELREIAIGISEFASRMQKAQAQKIANPNNAPRRSERNLLQTVKDSIEANRVELHLQPIVSLPQRRIAFYECYTRLRDNSGNLVLPGEFLRVAEHSGLVAEIDNMLLLKSVHLARKMVKRDKRISLFCNLSPTSLADESFFGQFIDFLRENRDLSGSIIFELTRDAFDRLSMTAERNMGRLFDLGFRFSIDRCDSIDLDLRKLERMGVRYVKIAGERLVEQLVRENVRPITGLAREFEAGDVASLFARYGVDLIADRVESERTIVEILELDLGFAQGMLFGMPKPEMEYIQGGEQVQTPLRRHVA
ncbi:MAG: EAL domain-containing protein [Caulobacterales bacterium]|nr:EAL domain-containing protein [Caulobacterales bacterium]